MENNWGVDCLSSYSAKREQPRKPYVPLYDEDYTWPPKPTPVRGFKAILVLIGVCAFCGIPLWVLMILDPQDYWPHWSLAGAQLFAVAAVLRYFEFYYWDQAIKAIRENRDRRYDDEIQRRMQAPVPPAYHASDSGEST